MLTRAHGRLPFSFGELSVGLVLGALLALQLGVIGFLGGTLLGTLVCSALRRADHNRRDWYLRPLRAAFTRKAATPLDPDRSSRPFLPR